MRRNNPSQGTSTHSLTHYRNLKVPVSLICISLKSETKPDYIFISLFLSFYFLSLSFSLCPCPLSTFFILISAHSVSLSLCTHPDVLSLFHLVHVLTYSQFLSFSFSLILVLSPGQSISLLISPYCNLFLALSFTLSLSVSLIYLSYLIYSHPDTCSYTVAAGHAVKIMNIH